MAQPIIENAFGKLTGWNRITYNLLGRDIVGIKRIYYNDKTNKTNAYGAGGNVIGREEGNYEPEAGHELYQEEVRALLRSLPPGKRLQDIPPFSILVEYQLPDGTIYRDRINNCEFTGNGVDIKQGDGSIVTDYKLITSGITWNAKA